MFKKLLAGATAVALALGMVALTAAPASAHSDDVSGVVSCDTESGAPWKITWTIANDYGTDAAITASTRAAVTAPTTVPAHSSVQFVEYFPTKPTSNVTLSITSSWPSDGFTRDNSTSVSKRDFSDGCNSVTPTAPTFTSALCTGPGAYGLAGYTIPTTEHITYEVRFTSSGSSGWSTAAAGDYTIAANGYVEVRASGLDGFSVRGTSSWKKNFSAPDCTYDATPTTPTITEAVCTGESQVGLASYVIPVIPGVQYKIQSGGSWTTIDPGTYTVADGSTVYLRAYATSGYELTNPDHEKSYTSFKVKFADISSSKCDVPAPPTPTYQECTAPGHSSNARYTIPIDSGVSYQIWDGGSWVTTAAGDVAVTTFPTQVKIRAVGTGGTILVPGSITEWTFDFVSAGDCLTEGIPGDPTFTDAECTAPGVPTTASYTIVGATGVFYKVSFDGVNYTTEGAEPGKHPVANGTHVSIKAFAESGYQILLPSEWDHEFPLIGDCIVDVPVAPASAVDQTCVEGDNGAGSYESGWIDIPSTDHVTYSIDSTPVSSGRHYLAPDSYEISAVADFGYTLTGYSGAYDLTISQAEACGDLVTHPLVTPVVTFVQETCAVSGSYLLAVVEDGSEAGVVWTVSGGLPNTAGTHTVTAPGTVTITVAPADGFGFAFEQQTEWTFTFASSADCLPTLALTGGGIAAGSLGLSALLLLAGSMLIAARHRKVAVEK